MIAVTQISQQRIFLDRRRPAVDDASGSSGFGSNITYLVGSVATRVGIRPPTDVSPTGMVDRSPGAGPPVEYQAVAESTLKPGMRLGPFRLLRLLGQGAQGDVWKAKRTEP